MSRSLRKAKAGHHAAPEATSADLQKYARLLKAWGEVVGYTVGSPTPPSPPTGERRRKASSLADAYDVLVGNVGDRAQKASKAVLPRSQRAAESPLARLVRLGQQLPGLHPDQRVATVTTARGLLAELDGVSLAPAADVAASAAPPARRRADIDDLRDLGDDGEAV